MTGVWSHLAGIPRNEAPDYWEYFGSRLAALADLPPGAHILDVGCGPGSSFIPAATKLDSSGFAVAADRDWEAVQECKTRSSQCGIEDASFAQMNAGDLALASDQFDFILSGFMGWNYCFDFVHNQYRCPDVRMREIQRVLRSGGQVLISSWAFQEDIEWLVDIFRKYLMRFAPDFVNLYTEDHLPYSKETPDGFEIIFRSAGLTAIQISTEHVNFASPDEDTWWEQMHRVGWRRYFSKLKQYSAEKYNQVKEGVYAELQSQKQKDGIVFSKTVIYAIARKP